MGLATVGPEVGPGPAGPALKPKERSLLLSAAAAADVETQSAKAPESDANLRVDATTAAWSNPHLRIFFKINEKWVWYGYGYRYG